MDRGLAGRLRVGLRAQTPLNRSQVRCAIGDGKTRLPQSDQAPARSAPEWCNQTQPRTVSDGYRLVIPASVWQEGQASSGAGLAENSTDGEPQTPAIEETGVQTGRQIPCAPHRRSW